MLGIDGSATVEQTWEQIARIARATAEAIGLGRALADEEIVLLDEWHAGTYGIPDAKTIDAIRLCARLEGVLTDPVYEGKSMAALIDLVGRGGSSRDPVCSTAVPVSGCPCCGVPTIAECARHGEGAAEMLAERRDCAADVARRELLVRPPAITTTSNPLSISTKPIAIRSVPRFVETARASREPPSPSETGGDTTVLFTFSLPPVTNAIAQSLAIARRPAFVWVCRCRSAKSECAAPASVSSQPTLTASASGPPPSLAARLEGSDEHRLPAEGRRLLNEEPRAWREVARPEHDARKLRRRYAHSLRGGRTARDARGESSRQGCGRPKTPRSCLPPRRFGSALSLDKLDDLHAEVLARRRSAEASRPSARIGREVAVQRSARAVRRLGVDVEGDPADDVELRRSSRRR